MKDLRSSIEELWSAPPTDFSREEARHVFTELKSALNSGHVRAAERDAGGTWRTNVWVKQGILLGFRVGSVVDMSTHGFSFFDKDNLGVRQFTPESNVRVVPGGSAIRDGAFVAAGVICMPPMYINIGAYVDEATMVDSHALIGTCAQIGKRVHVSAAAQIGGVLEPAGANPVIVEDDVLIGGNCGIYEGTIVRRRAVLASGVVLTASSKLYDTVNGRVITGSDGVALEVPEGAVVVAGTRRLSGEFASANGLSLSAAIIVKYRDDKTDARTALESALR